jgi:peptidoglycan/xylan/chitin deacetylase (PgdA/CDA1 family)
MTSRHVVAAVFVVLLAACRQAPPGPAAPPVNARAALAKSAPAPPAPEPRVWTRGERQVPVIMYHDVCRQPSIWFDLPTAQFEQQMAALKAADAQVVPLAEVVAHFRAGRPLPARAIALTFDDGTLGDFTDALPVLQRYGYPATFFVHTGYVGKQTSKDHMTWDQLRAAEQTGLIDVQPHTVTHPEDLSTFSDADLRAELRDSQEAIERELGHPARYYAYPYGNGDERVAAALDELGYLAGWVEVRAWCQAPLDRFYLPRFAPKRLGEVIAHWRRDAPSAWYAEPLPRVKGEAATEQVDGLQVNWGQWPTSGRALRRAGRVQPLTEGEQLAALAKPLVAASPEQVLFTRFGGWMNPSKSFKLIADPLPVLLPGVTDAVLGKAWVVHDGQPSGKATGRVLLGADAAGRLCTARALEPRPAERWHAAAAKLRLREAVLLQ